MATFRIEGMFGRIARLRTAEGTWTFRHEGMLGRRLAEAQGGGTLEYVPNWMGRGTARLATGAELRWRFVSLWRGVWAFSREHDDLVTFTRGRTFPRRSVRVTWSREARAWPELDALVALGWWILLTHRHHGR